MRIERSGRTDTADFFRLSDIRSCKKLIRTPALAFVEDEDGVVVQIVQDPRKLLDLPDDTGVMMQWSGTWRSDFFQFTVGDLRTYVTEHPGETHHVI